MRWDDVLTSTRFICLTGRRSELANFGDLDNVRCTLASGGAGLWPCNRMWPSLAEDVRWAPAPDRVTSVEDMEMCFELGISVSSSARRFLLPRPAASCESIIWLGMWACVDVEKRGWACVWLWLNKPGVM
jgi:hypothetical protein